jgi:hypothetical protein
VSCAEHTALDSVFTTRGYSNATMGFVGSGKDSIRDQIQGIIKQDNENA